MSTRKSRRDETRTGGKRTVMPSSEMKFYQGYILRVKMWCGDRRQGLGGETRVCQIIAVAGEL